MEISVSSKIGGGLHPNKQLLVTQGFQFCLFVQQAAVGEKRTHVKRRGCRNVCAKHVTVSFTTERAAHPVSQSGNPGDSCRPVCAASVNHSLHQRGSNKLQEMCSRKFFVGGNWKCVSVLFSLPYCLLRIFIVYAHALKHVRFISDSSPCNVFRMEPLTK